VHPAQVVAVAVLAGGDVVLAADRGRARRRVAGAGPQAAAVDGASGHSRGMTITGSVAVNDRVSSHIPNGSATRSRSGPTG
jgi:hypothetical protein